ncbi:MAG TPA: hypothetical protein VMB05_07450 [Solirubrobacteraceae bacterium]|nr:hypothetical protein [Solirubrobacteraceae bacterium]HUB74487.1 hypothetical protein [Solirubrobacteraceae bacterium]
MTEFFAPKDRNKSQQDVTDYDPLDHSVKGGSANAGSAYGVVATAARPGQSFRSGAAEGPHSAGTTVPGFVGVREVPGGEG